MKRSDFAVVGTIYAVSLFFYVQTTDLPPQAQTYPLGLIITLALLNTLYLVKQLYTGYKEGVIHNDMPILFKHFVPLQFAVIVIAALLYMAGMYYLGYYISSILFLVLTLAFLRVRWWQILLTMVVLFALIYGVFTFFLSVPLPVGVLFS